MPISEVYNCDCLEYMRSIPDKFFDLCIADPPYGIGFGMYNRDGKNRYHNAKWDNGIPSDDLFNELFRVSKEQIIWGGNYYPILWQNGCRGFIFWDKKQPVDNFSDGELAFTSFNKPARCFRYPYYGNINSEKNRIHPTQKPVALYSWLLDKYAIGGG